jgi:tetratricopeptide (TPR) repeat protein
MMKEAPLKYSFWLLSVILLAILLLTARNAGITCDEVLHYNQSQDVYNYFATGGKDRSALDTPVWHLKYYGQSFDNVVTILINWLGIEDVYSFRHLMSSIAGWLTVLVTALFAIWFSGYRSGIIVLFLFSISPSFMGHAHNNLKDIPFALGYISATFMIVRFLVNKERAPSSLLLLLTLSVALTMSIRAAGAVLIFYLVFFLIIQFAIIYFKEGPADKNEILHKLLLVTCISFIAYFLSILLWPYALQNPFRNVYEAYRVMAHYPDTFRQIFEGKVEWSDFMPWYFIPKSILITLPLVVLTGLVIFPVFLKNAIRNGKGIIIGMVVFTLIFPVLFAICEKSNLYSSWRQFLFIYPALVLLAAEGFNSLFEITAKKYIRWALIAIIASLAINPVRFMANNPHYFYLYYNQFVGGLKGAWANYETDYYYVSQTEASEWLINYLEAKEIKNKVKISATYSVQWQFRNHPEIETAYFRYDERSQSDWDYAIVANRYISPYKLRNGFWPPDNAIHIIYADSVPVCAVLERKSKDDYYGFLALADGSYDEAVNYYEKALLADAKDEMIFYNFAAVLYNIGEKQKADSLLKEGLKINPDCEPILMYLGNIARSNKSYDEAIMYYERLIKSDRKYFEAYVALSGLIMDTDVMKSRKLLRTCLLMNPEYKPAITALADTYRKTDPVIAEKYDKLADSVK